MIGSDVVTDLIGKLVSVSLWSHELDGLRFIMNGVVRSVGVQSDCFVLMIQAVRERSGNRTPGSLNVFTLGSRGGCEILVLDDDGSGSLAEYRALQIRMRALRDAGNASPGDINDLANAMSVIWTCLSHAEQSLILADAEIKLNAHP